MKTFEKYYLIVILAIGVLILGFVGCAGTPEAAQIAAKQAEPESSMLESSTEPADKEEAKLTISSPYDLDSILLPAIQLDYFRKSIDYFGQFAWDDDTIFPEYLSKIFWIDSGPYREGEGTVLKAGMDTGEGRFLLKRTLLETTEEGGKWWQVEMESEFDAVFFEVLVSPENFPLTIRYYHPETGAAREYKTVIAEQIEEYGMPSEDMLVMFRDEMDLEMENDKRYLFFNPEILGEEVIEVSSGKYMTVHVQDEIAGDTTTIADYWISPDVPGSIVKITYTSPQSEKAYITELTSITNDAMQRIDRVDANSSPHSEGGPADPVLITLNEPWYGSVSPGGISYYMVRTDRASDIYIEVSGHEGDAELIYYAQDAGFTNWTTSSQGYVMNVEDYFVDAGAVLYFAVQDHEDDYSQGEQYSISVFPNYILDPIGIMMKGEIYEEAEALETGRTYRETLLRTGLNYYSVEMNSGSRLKVTVTGLSDFAELIWFDTGEGVYSSAGTEWNQGDRTLDVTGLAPGTICYFYISGDIGSVPAGHSFQIDVEEY